MRRLRSTLLCAAALTLALPALAADGSTPMPGFGKRVSDRALAGQRGGTEPASTAALQGAVTGNQAVNVTTGGNTISGGAFAGAAGVPVVIQNSGNNVLVQSSVIVNLQLK